MNFSKSTQITSKVRLQLRFEIYNLLNQAIYDERNYESNPTNALFGTIDRRVIRQSMAIIEYLDETYDGETKLLPTTARDRARVRALAMLVACDIHPLNNTRVLKYLEKDLGADEAMRKRWIAHWIEDGFASFEELIARHPSTGQFCEGDTPTLADVCLVPQVYNARRFGVDL